MPVVYPTGAPMPRAMLGYDGANFYVLRTDATGHLQIDVVTSGLPAGAATEATLADVAAFVGDPAIRPPGSLNDYLAFSVTALQLIDDLRDALQTVANDRLIVRGEDQLFSFKGVLATYRSAAISGAGGYIDSVAVGPGEIWVVTTVAARDNTTAVSRIILTSRHDGANVDMQDEVRAFPIGVRSCWGGHTYLDEGDVCRATFVGGLAGDSCGIWLGGYRMTLEV